MYETHTNRILYRCVFVFNVFVVDFVFSSSTSVRQQTTRNKKFWCKQAPFFSCCGLHKTWSCCRCYYNSPEYVPVVFAIHYLLFDFCIEIIWVRSNDATSVLILYTKRKRRRKKNIYGQTDVWTHTGASTHHLACRRLVSLKQNQLNIMLMCDDIIIISAAFWGLYNPRAIAMTKPRKQQNKANQFHTGKLATNWIESNYSLNSFLICAIHFNINLQI